MSRPGLFPLWQSAYSALDVATFPVRTDGGEKTPAIKGWPKIGTERSRKLAADPRFANADSFGFALGRRSRVTVIDVDSPNENLLADTIDRHGKTPWLVRTGSGHFQLGYRHNGERRLAGNARPFVDAKGERLPIDLLGSGYVVAPPSIAPRGRYELLNGARIEDLARLPIARGLDHLREGSRTIATARELSRGPGPAAFEGERNDWLWRQCMKAAASCATFPELLAEAQALNQQGCIPTLDAEEVRGRAESAWGYQITGRNWFGRHGIVGLSREIVLSLAGPDTDALALLLLLQLHHSDRENFAIAKPMAEALGWRLPRFKRARTSL